MKTAQFQVHTLLLSGDEDWLILHFTYGILTSTLLEKALTVLKQAKPSQTVLLSSEALLLPQLNSSDERLAWLDVAGNYRLAQSDFQRQGGHIHSVVTQTLIGGTYLVHGMGASCRYLFTNAKVYPALVPEQYQQILHQAYPHPYNADFALAHQLITRLIPAGIKHSQIPHWVR